MHVYVCVGACVCISSAATWLAKVTLYRRDIASRRSSSPPSDRPESPTRGERMDPNGTHVIARDPAEIFTRAGHVVIGAG